MITAAFEIYQHPGKILPATAIRGGEPDSEEIAVESFHPWVIFQVTVEVLLG